MLHTSKSLAELMLIVFSSTVVLVCGDRKVSNTGKRKNWSLNVGRTSVIPVTDRETLGLSQEDRSYTVHITICFKQLTTQEDKGKGGWCPVLHSHVGNFVE